MYQDSYLGELAKVYDASAAHSIEVRYENR